VEEYLLSETAAGLSRKQWRPLPCCC